MAITIDWNTRVIFVPRDDLTVVQTSPTDIRNLDLNWFRIQLKNLEDSEIGMAYPDTHSHNTTVVLSGITYARVIELVNNFTVTFEDGQYAVNLIGANSNVGDRVNVNNVSVRSSNSAGMVIISEGSSTGSVSETDIHNALNSYTNKNAYKADVSSLATSANLASVANNVVTVKDGIITLQQDIATVNLGVVGLETTVENIDTGLDNLVLDINAIEVKTLEIDSAIENLNIPTAIDNANATWSHNIATQLVLDISFIKGIEGGKWEIVNNQMIFYAANNTTELARFNLYNKSGILSEENVFKRIRL